MSLDKRVLSWCLYDFANSSYSAVIAAVIFPVYYTTVIAGNETGLGDLWWGRAISLSMAVVALTSPFVGSIADLANLRKRLLITYTLLSVLAVSSLSFLQEGMYREGFLLITIANIGMEGALVFYNSYLPLIAPQDRQGRVSGWGFAIGYAGSIISLLLALLLIKQGYINLVWPMTALFFALFSVPLFINTPQDRAVEGSIVGHALRGFRGAVETLKALLKNRPQRRFLLAYLIYEDGVNTVIVFSSIFAATTLKFQTGELITLYLIVQVTALVGAFVMARPIDTMGPKKVIMLSLLLWTTVSVSSYFVYDKGVFFIVACIAGLGLGTVQAASRAFFAQFIPYGKESEYFGVYSLVGKSSASLGPLVFGSLSAMYGSQRSAVVSVAVFFLLGMVVLSLVDTKRASLSVHREGFRP